MRLNFFPINLGSEKYQINAEPYSDERIKELRNKYNVTHSFFRDGDKIYISNNQEAEVVFLGTTEQVNAFENYTITAALIKHVFFRDFKDRFKRYTPIDFYPFRFFSGKDDLILNLLPDSLKGRISYKKVIEIQLRKIEHNSNSMFGFIINIDRNWIFSINCEEIYKEGFPLEEVEVIHAENLPGLENVLAPNEEFIGRVKSIQGSVATVSTNNGDEDFLLSELFIRKTRFNIGNYLNFKIGREKSTKIFDEIKRRTPEIYNAENLYKEIVNIATPLFIDKDNNQTTPHLFQNKDGFCFTVDANPLQLDNSIELSNPSFIFHYDGTKKSNYADKGLTDFGPYDSTTFDIKNPKILAICHKSIRGTFSTFLANLRDGLPDSNYFKKGLLGKYELHSADMNNIQEVHEYTKMSYLNAITEFIKNSNEKPHLAIVEIPSSFRQLGDKDNPYYEIKAKLLSLEIPVQLVTTEKVKGFNEYILNSIALQIYAKLGGTPWVLPTKPSVDREIVIGIGHSWMRDNQYKGAEQNRIVGITTFLSGDGQYLLGEKIKDVKYDDYFDELLKSLEESINLISNEYAWQDGATVRLLFHVFKPIKNIEFDVIGALIKKISRFKIQFAFITISKKHPFLLFDIEQNGIRDKFGNEKGKFIPTRAQNIIIDNETCIVQMIGPNELKTTKHGMSSPIQIKIRRPSNIEQNLELNSMLYYDLSYIVQQVYAFTYLSWRGFLPSDEPATMLYSNLISRLLGKMKNVSNWNVDNLNYGLKRKKWFL
ncbi:Piwi domain-containing protein [Dysgonomonas sp. 520]|uniref:Piwi domain-containing protein n=1 Tax=Dysgonomonas sp. 520 TaxID=2302931 RepID=UPI0013D89158|nr:Piwi domain-containing protein [Dysgonomonas sp. 520]NDW11079.1 Piwi domain protein [Dysgonomonas sp. 520]